MHYVLLSQEELYPAVELRSTLANVLWVEGERFQDVVPPLEFDFQPENGFTWVDYLDPMADIPLFSPDARGVLEKAGIDNVDYYPAGVTNRATGERRPYFAANVIGLVRGVDRTRAVFTPFEEGSFQIEFFERLALDEAAIEGLGLFRLAEFSLLLIVDERVKRLCEERGLIGLEFFKPEEWDGFRV